MMPNQWLAVQVHLRMAHPLYLPRLVFSSFHLRFACIPSIPLPNFTFLPLVVPLLLSLIRLPCVQQAMTMPNIPGGVPPGVGGTPAHLST